MSFPSGTPSILGFLLSVSNYSGGPKLWHLIPQVNDCGFLLEF